ncbi:acetylornithine aminotransferase [Geomicrobium sp. JCM 19037]|uniref:acetylornithine/succinylornithine family transaminase n=1 Tax=Geomicrobium sp. JCM 19037 TaxID=1460634 RepID=UPI00045F2E17|nr:acetylornithine/succinylornithine family transaminase [Geomicrobium sp. JCM 19037]GAK05765.1 acetylornithine aminotransferase [Geomicrobium sp. JCM 19037]
MQTTETNHLFPTYKRWDLTWNRADGSKIYANDQVFLDFMTGIGTVNMGHGHPAIIGAVEEQLHAGWHASNMFHYKSQQRAADTLSQLSGLHNVFFTNSGAESNEAAIKLARKATGRSEIVSFHQSFHGRTYASMTATGQEKVREGYDPLPEGFTYATFNDANELEQIVSSETAAILLEVVQGEGGVNIGSASFLQAVENIAKKNGALVIIDEVQTGIGRTGYPFAFQQYGMNPDIITSAKGLGNGFPVGAMIGRKGLEVYFGAGSHGTTFGGNPLAMSAVNATLSLLNDQLLTAVIEKGKLVQTFLETAQQHLQVIKEVRVSGLMIGLELDCDAGMIVEKLQDEGILTLVAGKNVLRLYLHLRSTHKNLSKDYK